MIQAFTPEWFAARQTKITASDVGAVLGFSPHRSPLDVWAKLTGRKTEEQELEEKPWLAWGRYLEPSVAAWYSDETGYEVTPVGELITDPELEWLAATPDYLADVQGEMAALECKAPGDARAKQWLEYGSIPVHIKAQIQIQLRVMGLERGVLAAASATRGLLYFDVTYDPTQVERLIKYLARWRDEFVMADREPPASKEDAHALLELHPKDNGKMVVLGNSGCIVASELAEMQERAKKLKDEIDHRKNVLRQAIGDNTYADAGDGRFWQWKHQTTQRKATEATTIETRALRAIKKIPSGLEIASCNEIKSLEQELRESISTLKS